jgi:hypothetical protein
VFTPTNVARFVRAAPQLETLIIFASGVDVDWSLLVHPAFGELVHLKLKRIRVSGLGSTTLLKSGFFWRLRQRCLPLLKELAIVGCEYFVTPLESPSFARCLLKRLLQFAAGLAPRVWERRN